MNEKIMWILESKYSLFHADLICRAMHDDSISLEDFINGCKKISESERDDVDEFVPNEFKSL
jgi:hypothetical protein